MPLYYFDYRVGGKLSQDDIGTEFQGFEEAKVEAFRALGEFATDQLQEAESYRLAIEVRDGNVPVLQVVMTVEVKLLV